MAKEITYIEKNGKQVLIANDRDYIMVGVTQRGEQTWHRGSSYARVRELKDGARASCAADFMEVLDKVMGAGDWRPSMLLAVGMVT